MSIRQCDDHPLWMVRNPGAPVGEQYLRATPPHHVVKFRSESGARAAALKAGHGWKAMRLSSSGGRASCAWCPVDTLTEEEADYRRRAWLSDMPPSPRCEVRP